MIVENSLIIVYRYICGTVADWLELSTSNVESTGSTLVGFCWMNHAMFVSICVCEYVMMHACT